MRYFIFTLVGLSVLLFSSCVTSGDLRDFRQATDNAFLEVIEAQEGFEQRTAEIIADTSKTSDERLKDIEEANKERLAKIEEAAREAGIAQEAVLWAIRDRTVSVGKNIAQMDWMELLLTLFGTALTGGAGAVVATNKIRDNRRVHRGEPVNPDKA